MFKRKNKKDSALKINIKPVEVTPEDTPRKRGLRFILFLVLSFLVFIFVLSFILNYIENNAPDETEPTYEDLDNIDPLHPVDLNDPVLNEPVLNEPSSGEETDPNETTDPDNGDFNNQPIDPIIPDSPVEGYVYYTNGILGLEFLYPEDWYYYERSGSILSDLNRIRGEEGVLDLGSNDLDFVIPVADFESPDLDNHITISVSIQSPEYVSLLLQGKPTSTLEINGYVATHSVMEVDDFGITREVADFVLSFGNNFIVYHTNIVQSEKENIPLQDIILVMYEYMRTTLEVES